MATADQIKRLIKAHIENDNDNFKTIVLQIAAYEAKLNHENLARDLKKLADKVGNSKITNRKIQDAKLDHLFIIDYPSHELEDLIVSEELLEKIKRILNEFLNKKKLQSYGLTNRRKILLEGAPGTGKTFTASVIASQIGLPLYIVQMDKLVTKYMGETSAKLRQIFDFIETIEGVYFFDEFDAIGADRSLDNEVGEMRRVLNSFLQFIEQDTSNSLIIAATNYQNLLDQALFRRFDDVLHYSMPTQTEVKSLFEHKLSIFQSEFIPSNELIKRSENLSHAEIIRLCDDAIKDSILTNSILTEQKLLELVDERMMIYSRKRG